MSNPEKALAQRIRELRRRHFGARGKAQFAQKLNLSLADYERYERGTIPPGEVLVRICDATGEDLQWLLTGVASRGTVVISGARNRHQDLLARIAQALDTQPHVARAIESFLDLLLADGESQSDQRAALPHAPAGDLIPVYAAGQWPETLPNPDGPGGLPLLESTTSLECRGRQVNALLAEPAMEYDPSKARTTTMLIADGNPGQPQQFVRCADVTQCFQAAFGVVLADESMGPMLRKGDIALVAPRVEPTVGRPAILRFKTASENRCRIWLGGDDKYVNLGRVSDGQHEQATRAELLWSLEVIYRVAQAA